MKKRIIPKKNYIILLLIAVFVVAICMYLVSWYKTIDNYYKTNSVISEVLNDIDSESLSSYLLDNPNVIMYLSSSSDLEIKDFEKKLKKEIVSKQINDSIIYIDVDEIKNSEISNILVTSYLSKPLKKVSSISSPNFVAFKNGEIVDILSFSDEELNIIDVLKFLKRNEVIEND